MIDFDYLNKLCIEDHDEFLKECERIHNATTFEEDETGYKEVVSA